MMLRRAVFLDRDGVVNYPIFRNGFEKPTAPFGFDELQIIDGTEDGLAILAKMRFLRILVTNQPDVGYGHLSYEEWRKIQDEVEKLDFDDVFICQHTRNDNCECKKPKPGMLLSAQQKWRIDFLRSYIVGDAESDMVAGKTVGCKTILVKAAYNESVASDFRVGNLFEAARLISCLEERRQ